MDELMEVLEKQVEINKVLNEQFVFLSNEISILFEEVDKLKKEVEELKGRA